MLVLLDYGLSSRDNLGISHLANSLEFARRPADDNITTHALHRHLPEFLGLTRKDPR
jgi:hypothetical protein